jgi:LysR family nitrogen assimilation transcriptional regulator
MAGTGITLRQIRYFSAVTHHSSLSGAARALNVSQPALGLQIRQLEERLGAVLLTRNVRGVELTLAGEKFLGQAKKVLDAVDQAERITSFEGERQEIALGVTASTARALYSDLSQRPEFSPDSGYDLNMRERGSAELIQLVRAGKLHGALCHQPAPDPAFQCTALFSEELFLIGSKEVIGNRRKAVSYAELDQFSIVLSTRKNAGRQYIEKELARGGKELAVAIDVSPLSIRHDLILNRGFCTIGSRASFLSEIKSGEFKTLKLTPPIIRTVALIVGRKVEPELSRRLHSLVQACIAARIADSTWNWQAISDDNN